MPKHKETKISPKDQAQSVGLLGGFISFFIAYPGAEAALNLKPHPYHWITAFSAATVIGISGYALVLWQQKRRRTK